MIEAADRRSICTEFPAVTAKLKCIRTGTIVYNDSEQGNCVEQCRKHLHSQSSKNTAFIGLIVA